MYAAMFASRVSLLLLVLLYMECCHTASIPPGYDRTSEEVIVKRPFCNAFTGCGRKRSVAAPGMPLQELTPRQMSQVFSQGAVMKRLFCNTYSGCGRKRSLERASGAGVPFQEIKTRQYVDEDSLSSILDSEQAIDELSRQIISEAKLWEAIQEASAEIARRKQKEAANYQ